MWKDNIPRDSPLGLRLPTLTKILHSRLLRKYLWGQRSKDTCGASGPRNGPRTSSIDAPTRPIARTCIATWKMHGWATSGTTCASVLNCTTTFLKPAPCCPIWTFPRSNESKKRVKDRGYKGGRWFKRKFLLAMDWERYSFESCQDSRDRMRLGPCIM